MSYQVKYISCRVCGKDTPRWLGVRGNKEHAGVDTDVGENVEHLVTNVVRCQYCHFVYTNPLILNEGATALEGGYGEAEVYDASSSVNPEILFVQTLKKIEQFRKPPGVLLDIGCGKGEFLKVARDRGWSVAGVEASRGMAEYATKTLKLDVFCGSLKDSKWPDHSFDVITLNMVLEHVHAPHDLFGDISRLLKPDGILFVEVPNMDSFMLACARFYFRLRKLDWSPLLSPLHPPYHCYGYNKKSLAKLAGQHGFKPKKVMITDTRWRGFRPEGGHLRFEKWVRNATTGFSYFIGRGDVLLMILGRRG